jgi:CheY-like chemotaxis protein
MSAKKIIIVEDEGIVCNDLRCYLSQIGYNVTASYYSGEEALKSCRNNPPDAALIDIGLQGQIDGIETAKQIMNQLNIPVIYITGYADKSTISQARDTHPADLLQKPINEDELKAALDRVFSLNYS